MRGYVISLAAASLLVPAAAHAEDGGFLRGIRNHAERSSPKDDNSGDRSSRSQSVQRAERSDGDRSDSHRSVRVEREPRSERASDAVRRVERVDNDSMAPRAERIGGAERGTQHSERNRRGDRDIQQVEQAQGTEPVQRTPRTERRYDGLAGAVSRAGRDMADGRNDRDGTRDWRRDGDGDRDWRRDRDGRHDWSRDWRRDRRYDWWSYRNHYGMLFRLGRYDDPYSWGYRRYLTGLSLWPSYYGSSYWLDDPWRYRLPPAYGPYRWIRYYGDALLVNIHTGQVVDVVHDVFR